jgi:hypothetical protein
MNIRHVLVVIASLIPTKTWASEFTLGDVLDGSGL